MGTAPDEALDLARAILARLDAAAPGLVCGLHLVGSAVLNDWRPPESDLDLVGVVSRPPTEAERAALSEALGGGPPKVEAEWLSEADLVSPPATAAVAVALRTLARDGVAIRGALPADLWDDPSLLADLLRANLDTYWDRWMRQARKPFSVLSLAMLDGWAPAWGVLGVARIAYTLQVGEITSKTGAGRWALAAFPEHARVIRECLRLRTGQGGKAYREPFTRKRQALAAMAAMVSRARSGCPARHS